MHFITDQFFYPDTMEEVLVHYSIIFIEQVNRINRDMDVLQNILIDFLNVRIFQFRLFLMTIYYS